MERSFRDYLIAIVTFLGGLYFFLIFILPEEVLKQAGVNDIQDRITLGFVSIGLVTFGLGLINLFMIHGAKIVFIRKGWFNSLALLIGLLMMLFFSISDWMIDLKMQKRSADLAMLGEFATRIVEDSKANKQDTPPTDVRIKAFIDSSKVSIQRHAEETALSASSSTKDLNSAAIQISSDLNALSAQILSQVTELENAPAEYLVLLPKLSESLTQMFGLRREFLSQISKSFFSKKMYSLLFEGLFVSLGSAMFSLLGVYIAAAAYRAFRIKTIESSFMMLAALIVMLGQIPFGLWISDSMPDIRDWILRIPSGAAARGITIGASIAGLVLAFRMWFSIESGSFSKAKK